MTPDRPVEPGADPNVALQERAIRTFFDRWNVYQRVIRNDYMFHRGIHEVIASRLGSLADFRVLDLGCGDAQLTALTLSPLSVREYVGVDLSPIALKLAQENLEAVGVASRFHAAGMLNYLAEDAQEESFDIVLAGYVAHHLVGKDRERFLAQVRRVLAPNGALLLFDVFRHCNESREDNLHRNHQWRERTWTAMSPEDLTAIWDHVSTADYPFSREELTELVARAGFDNPPRLLFRAHTGIHRLYAIH